MLTVSHGQRGKNCSGTSRRDFLNAGTLALGGLSLPWLLKAKALAAGDPAFVRDKSVVVLFLSGGASHIETFNPNMDVPAPYHSVNGAVQTAIPGVAYGGTFPGLARHAGKIAVVRSFQHPVAGHEQAIKHVLNGGTDPDGRGSRGFSIGAAYSRLRGANDPRSGMPSFALLNSAEVDPQYIKERRRVERGSHSGTLAPAFAPYNPDGTGASQQNMQLSIPLARLDDRRSLLSGIDRLQQRVENDARLANADKYQSQAFELILGSASKAFDLSKEDSRLVDEYDTSRFRVGKKEFRNSQLGRHFLVARRLIEVGCRFVTIHSAGWDMHADRNNPGIQQGMEMLGRPVDQAVSVFLEDLERRGMINDVLLIVTGDFGRTPTINTRGGRDHWPRLCTLAFAGGGITGQVIGKSARQNDVPATDPINPGHLTSTMMHWLLDMGALRVFQGVPRELMRVLEDNQPIRELV